MVRMKLKIINLSLPPQAPNHFHKLVSGHSPLHPWSRSSSQHPAFSPSPRRPTGGRAPSSHPASSVLRSVRSPRKELPRARLSRSPGLAARHVQSWTGGWLRPPADRLSPSDWSTRRGGRGEGREWSFPWQWSVGMTGTTRGTMDRPPMTNDVYQWRQNNKYQIPGGFAAL